MSHKAISYPENDELFWDITFMCFCFVLFFFKVSFGLWLSPLLSVACFTVWYRGCKAQGSAGSRSRHLPKSSEESKSERRLFKRTLSALIYHAEHYILLTFYKSDQHKAHQIWIKSASPETETISCSTPVYTTYAAMYGTQCETIKQ